MNNSLTPTNSASSRRFPRGYSVFLKLSTTREPMGVTHEWPSGGRLQALVVPHSLHQAARQH